MPGSSFPRSTSTCGRCRCRQSEYPLQYRTIKQISETAQIILDSGEEASIMETMSLITRKRQANVCPSGIVIKDTRPDSPTYGEVLLDVGARSPRA
jgi:hypothetical protein